MSESAASLLRPKAPKAGKRVFLEYIPAVWSRMKFMHKVSVRNIFRYKKRFFMMVVGISGCTALLLTGFGLKDSIATFVDSQYEEIQVAKAELLMEETEGDSLPEDLTKTLKELDATCFPYQQTSWDLQLEDRVKGVTVIVPQDWSDIDSYFRLKDMKGEKIPKAGHGEALISISI
jgi:putative ABC transport system permease protein